jgi:hypothetical protein
MLTHGPLSSENITYRLAVQSAEETVFITAIPFSTLFIPFTKLHMRSKF